jgi:hypothetical protein
MPCSAALMHVPVKGHAVSVPLRLPSDEMPASDFCVVIIVARELACPLTCTRMFVARLGVTMHYCHACPEWIRLCIDTSSNSCQIMSCIFFLDSSLHRCVVQHLFHAAGECLDMKGIGIRHGSQLVPRLTGDRIFSLLKPRENVLYGCCSSLKQAKNEVWFPC